MSYIDTLLQKRNDSAATPFWKLHIDEDELAGLIEYIKAEVSSVPFYALSLSERKRRYLSFDREACLLYALWWSRKYDGGKQSWEEALADFGIDLNYLDCIKEAVLNELKHNRRLGITIFRSEADFHMYLQSLLAQGGLPMQLMSSEYSSSFENYLYYLISEYEEMDMRDWTNISIAKSLADKYLNNRTLRESEAVIDFSLEIVKAYIGKDDAAFNNYDEIKQIIAHIREKRGNSNKIERKYFKISWEIKMMLNSFELYYSVSVPHEVILDHSYQRDNEGNDVNIVSYYIANRLVGSYHKQGEKYLLMPGTSLSQKIKWNSNQAPLTLTRKIKNELSEDHSLINSQPPFLDEPLLLQYKGGAWIPKQIRNNDTYGCLIPKGWECEEISSHTNLDHEGLSYGWIEINWSNIVSGTLRFKNIETGEEIALDNTISDYSVSFVPQLPRWIESSSELVVVNNDDLRLYFRCFKEDVPVTRQGFKFLYKTNGSLEYLKYSGGKLPCGPTTIKVEYPEGNQSKTFSFYNIVGLQVDSEGKDKLKVSFQEGTFALLADQNIIKLGVDLYQIADKHNLGGLAPIMFRLYPNNVQRYIELGFSSPIQKSCFIDNNGRILEKTFPVAMSELHNFKINLSDYSKIILSYYEQIDMLPTCVTRKEISLGRGRYPLDIIKDEIERLVIINGFNDYRKFISVKIVGTDSELKIRRNAYRAQQCTNSTGEKGVFVRRNNEPASELQLHAIAVNVLSDSPLYHSDEIIMIESEEPGHYYLPDLEDDRAKEFVVFSDNTLDNGNMLAFFLNTGEDMDKESRDSNKSLSIDSIKKQLIEGNEQEWKNTWFYVDLVIKYRLSYFNSFNTFFAIVNDPYLLSEFLVRLQSSELMNNYDKATILNELQRMERELSFRFHYLPSICWQKQHQRLEAEYDAIIAAAPFLKETIGDKMSYADGKMSLFKELLVCQFGESEMVILQIFYSLLGNKWHQKPDYQNQEREYLMKLSDALADFEKFFTPKDLNILRVEYHKLRPWNRYHSEEVIQKLQYLAMVLPQCAAQYVHGADMNLWQYQADSNVNEFIRRMINYISIYASEVYNELFTTALLRNPVTQTSK